MTSEDVKAIPRLSRPCSVVINRSCWCHRQFGVASMLCIQFCNYWPPMTMCTIHVWRKTERNSSFSINLFYHSVCYRINVHSLIGIGHDGFIWIYRDGSFGIGGDDGRVLASNLSESPSFRRWRCFDCDRLRPSRSEVTAVKWRVTEN